MPEHFVPDFFGKEGDDGAYELYEAFGIFKREVPSVGGFLVNGVYEYHHLRYCGIYLKRHIVFADLFNRLVVYFFKVFVGCVGYNVHFKIQSVYPVYELLYALYVRCVPGFGVCHGTHKHFVHSKNVCAVVAHNVVGVYDVALGLGHLFAVFAKNHALMEELFERFFVRHVTFVVKEIVPES